MPPELAHLCVIRRYGEWVDASGIASGYVFRKIDSYDRVIHADEAMVCISAEVGLYPLICSLVFRAVS